MWLHIRVHVCGMQKNVPLRLTSVLAAVIRSGPESRKEYACPGRMKRTVPAVRYNSFAKQPFFVFCYGFEDRTSKRKCSRCNQNRTATVCCRGRNMDTRVARSGCTPDRDGNSWQQHAVTLCKAAHSPPAGSFLIVNKFLSQLEVCPPAARAA